MHENRQFPIVPTRKLATPTAEVTAFFLRPEACWSVASRRVAQHFIVARVRKRQYEEESKRAMWSVGGWRVGLRVRSGRENRVWGSLWISRISLTDIAIWITVSSDGNKRSRLSFNVLSNCQSIKVSYRIVIRQTKPLIWSMQDTVYIDV